MTDPRLSVVVPFFNVQDYVVPCLESLRRQTFADLEVVLVDDGSTDGSFERVSALAARDERFRVLRQDNHGPGPARNTGIAAARGELLAFVDSDDYVPRRAFQSMVETLDISGSDLATGNARRFDNMAVWQSYAHSESFGETRLKTTVRELPGLALDRMVWNKVYRRSFWDEAGLTFPDMLYEDYPVCVAAHVRARAVDVVQDPVYYWRERDGGELSITQRTWQLDNLRDRVDSGEMVLDMLAAQASQEGVDVAAAHLLHIDVAAVIAAVHHNDPAQHQAILGLAQRLLARIPRHVREEARPFDRVQAVLIEQGRLDDLRTLQQWREDEGIGARIVTRLRGARRQQYLDLPLFGSGSVPREAYRLREPHRLWPTVLDAHWTARRLHLDLDIGLAPMALGRVARVHVWLQSPEDERIPLQVERYERLVNRVGRERTGARVVIDPTTLPGWPRRATWALHVGISTPQITTSAPVDAVASNRARLMGPQFFDDGAVVQVARRVGAYGLWVRRPDTVVEKAAPLVDEIELRGWFQAEEPVEEVALQVLVREGVTLESLPVTYRRAGGESTPGLHEWSARIPARLVVDHDVYDPVEEQSTWMVRLQVDGMLRQVVVGAQFPGAHVSTHWRTVSATRSPLGNLVLTESLCSPRLTDVTWDGDRLLVRGEWDGPGPLDDELVLRTYPTPSARIDVPVPLAQQDGCFRAVVDVAGLIAESERVPVTGADARRPKPWNLMFRCGEHELTPTVCRDLPTATPPPRVLAGRRAWLMVDRGDTARLVLRPE